MRCTQALVCFVLLVFSINSHAFSDEVLHLCNDRAEMAELIMSARQNGESKEILKTQFKETPWVYTYIDEAFEETVYATWQVRERASREFGKSEFNECLDAFE